MKTYKDLTGQRFGKLVVQKIIKYEKNSIKLIKWEAICDCGKTCIKTRDSLLSSKIPSCGCYDHRVELMIVKIIDGKKNCAVCNNLFTIDNFKVSDMIECGFDVQCKNCRFISTWMYGYNISRVYATELYNKIKENGCEICGIKTDNITLDHNHTTGFVRAAICRSCNSTIGLFKENIKTLTYAILYLEKHD